MNPLEEAREPRTDWASVAFGVTLGVLAAYQQFKLPPALPVLFRLYGYDRVLAGGFMSIYALTGLLFSVAIGRSLARRGPTGLLIGAFGLLLGGNALALGLARLGWVMLLSRLLEGLAFSILAVVGGVVATTSAVGRDRLIAVGLWTTWIPLGQVASSLLAAPVTGAGLWRPLWWVAMLGTLAVAMWGRVLGVGVRRAARGPASVRPESGAQPAACRRPGREKLLLLSAGLFSLWTTTYLAFMSWLPQYLVEAQGLSPGKAAFVYLLPPALVVAFNLVAGALLRAGAGLGLLLTGSIGVQAAVWFLIPVLGAGPSGVLALLAYGISCGVTPTCLFALPGAILGDGSGASHGFAVIMTGRNLGALIGPVLLAQVVALAGSWNVVAPVFGAICLAAVGVAAAIGWRLARAV